MTTAAPRTVTLLGSTGSIGTQAIEIAVADPDRFRVTGLAAGGSDLRLLAQQALALRVETIAVARGTQEQVRDALGYVCREAGDAAYAPEVLVGDGASTQLAAREADVVVNGITGAIGLEPTLAALEAGRTLALANKESLIVGGPLVKAIARPGQIVPVDSEHSAIAQCLRGGTPDEVQRLVVTASGGPFLGRSREELHDVTPRQALAHPNFAMGRVVTTNSATLVNKGLEVIEAHLLFDVPFERIDVVVHPQQMIHSMVEFVDGSTIAQVSPPSMLIPIAMGMAWPARVPGAGPACDWSTASTWQFLPLDDEAFPAVALAKRAGVAGGTAPAVFNAANEVCVDAFHDGLIPFTAIVETVSRVVEEHLQEADLGAALDLPAVLAADGAARGRARDLLGLGDDGTGSRAAGPGPHHRAGSSSQLGPA